MPLYVYAFVTCLVLVPFPLWFRLSFSLSLPLANRVLHPMLAPLCVCTIPSHCLLICALYVLRSLRGTPATPSDLRV
jgi:hypothetical protein